MTAASPPPETWRLLPFDVGSSTAHFASSDALARLGRVPTVWWHSADRPTLILGPGQRGDEIDPSVCAGQGVLLVRRQAGGTAVFAAPDVLGQDIFVPSGHRLALSDVVEAYRWVGEVWVDAVRALGAPANLVSVAEARAAVPSGRFQHIVQMACFGSLSPYEVTVCGRKLVGLSQLRRRAGVLWQSGIHLRFDASGLSRLLAPENEREVAQVLSQAAMGLDEAAPGKSLGDIITAFAQALAARQAVTLHPGSWDEIELSWATQHGCDQVGRV